MISTFYDETELKSLGFKQYGNNILVSKKCSIYEPEKVSLGDNVRIDDFSILSGSITLGSFVHISAMVSLYGRYGIVIDDFCGVSPHCIIFSATDDFSGDTLIGPMVPPHLTKVHLGRVLLNKYVQIGAGSIVMPDVEVGIGSVVGAMSFVNKNVEKWKIVAGIPARVIKDRGRNLVHLADSISG